MACDSYSLFLVSGYPIMLALTCSEAIADEALDEQSRTKHRSLFYRQMSSRLLAWNDNYLAFER